MRPPIVFSLLALLLIGLVVYTGMTRQPAIPDANLVGTPTFSGILDTSTPIGTLADTNPLTTPTYPPGREPMKLPRNFRDAFILYAVVDRSDAMTRKIYISPEAVAALRAGQDLPERTQIVVEAFHAALDANGSLLTNADGHLIPAAADPEIHIAELRSTWQIEDLASSAHLGNWNFDAFDSSSGAPHTADRADCFSCHESARSTNFLFTDALLTQYAATGVIQYMDCPLPARVPCTR